MKNYNLQDTPSEYNKCIPAMTHALRRLDNRQKLLYPVLGDYKWDDQTIIKRMARWCPGCFHGISK